MPSPSRRTPQLLIPLNFTWLFHPVDVLLRTLEHSWPLGSFAPHLTGFPRSGRSPHFLPHPQAAPSALAKCVLAEVPRQVVEYYASQGISPGVPRPCTPATTPSPSP